MFHAQFIGPMLQSVWILFSMTSILCNNFLKLNTDVYDDMVTVVLQTQ